MEYFFDDFGILSAEPIPGRSTTVAPPETPLPDDHVWRWEGYSWGAFDPTPPAPTPAEPEPYANFIDVGPFFDRFSVAKMAVLTSSDIGVQAIIKDVQVRKWVDLTHPEVASALTYISSKVPTVTEALRESILTAPITDAESLALRKLYFS